MNSSLTVSFSTRDDQCGNTLCRERIYKDLEGVGLVEAWCEKDLTWHYLWRNMHAWYMHWTKATTVLSRYLLLFFIMCEVKAAKGIQVFIGREQMVSSWQNIVKVATIGWLIPTGMSTSLIFRCLHFTFLQSLRASLGLCPLSGVLNISAKSLYQDRLIGCTVVQKNHV